MYQSVNFQNSQELSSLKSLILTCAISSVILAIPGIGWIISVFFLPIIALIVIASMTLSKVKKYKLSSTGSILVLCASICSLLSTFSTSLLPYFEMRTSFSSTTLSLIVLLISFISWVLFVNAAIVLFGEHKKILLQTPRYNNFLNQPFQNSPFVQQVHMNSYFSAQQTPPSPFQQTPVSSPFPTQQTPPSPFQQAPVNSPFPTQQTSPSSFQQAPVSSPFPTQQTPPSPNPITADNINTPEITETNLSKSQEALFSEEISHKPLNPFHTPKQTATDAESNSLFIQTDLNE